MLSPRKRVRRGCPGGDREPLHKGEAKPCAFLDRDGVLNRDLGYVSAEDAFEWICGARDAIDRLKDAGYWVVVVTNQSGIERGYYTEDDFLTLSDWMLPQTRIDLILYCPHLEGDCPARKPNPGMIAAASAILPIDLTRSFLVGDKDTDMEAAKAAGIPGWKFHEDQGCLSSYLEALEAFG